MQASAKTVGEILEPRGQFVIPFFQRHYSWEQKQWRRLWNDLVKLLDLGAASPDSRAVHFLGPLVTIPLTATPGALPAWQVIDGQQRLTTLTLLLSALRDLCLAAGESDVAAEITDTCLLNLHKSGLDRYKVITRVGDREVLEKIIEGQELPDIDKSRIASGHRFFTDRIRTLAAREPASLKRLMMATTARLSLVTITLEGENPYEIFESLNATGLPLEESDLIRNYLFMQVPLSEQAAFQDRSWGKLEDVFANRKRAGGIPTDFFRSYLMREGSYSKQKQTYIDFRNEHQPGICVPEAVVNELRAFAEYDAWLYDPTICDDKELRRRLFQLRLLDTSTARPMVFHLLNRRAADALGHEELLGCLDDLISFLLRRSVCGESTQSYSRWLVDMIGQIAPSQVRESLQHYYARRGWPDDDTFIAALTTFPIYLREFGKARLVLEGLEGDLNPREQIDSDGISIEHVLPRTLGEGASGAAWRAALGDGWEDAHERLVHVIGNLSLTGANSDMGNRDFAAKKEILKSSRFLLNREIAQHEQWTAATIEARSHALALRAAALWPRPVGLPSARQARAGSRSRAETKEAKVQYWEAVLPSLQELDFVEAVPQARTVGLVTLPLTRKAFNYGLRPRFQKRQLSLLLFLRGEDRERNFDELFKERAAIEQGVESSLQWKKIVRWTRSTSVVELSCDHLDPNDLSSIPLQAKWFVENLRRFHEAFHDRCVALAPTDTPRKMTPIRAKRQRWWAMVLEELAKHSDLFEGRKAPAETWIGAGSGTSGVGFVLAANRSTSHAELYIDKGEGADEENKRIFDLLKTRQAEIEAAFGEPLRWDRLNKKRASRIRWTQPAGYDLPEEQWPEATAAQAHAMARFRTALGPILNAALR